MYIIKILLATSTFLSWECARVLGLNDGIILDGFGLDQDISWQIETECQSLFISSSVFDLQPDRAYLYIGEGDNRNSFTGNSPISHPINTGNVTISFNSDDSYRKSLKI